MESAPKGEKQSNGLAEKGVRDVCDMARTWKSVVESKYGFTMKADHVLVPYLYGHGAELITRFRLGPDGLTGHHRVRGKPSNIRILPFGEKVLFKPAMNAGIRRKMEMNYEHGIWVGIDPETSESILITPGGRRTSPSIRRLIPDTTIC